MASGAMMEIGATGMSRRRFLRLAGCGAALATWSGGCGRDERAGQRPGYSGPARHVILISLDTTRRDHFGCYGNPWIRTPRIDALASESILFEDYMTVAPTTLPSHASLFTGQYPHSHGTPRNGFVVNSQNVMLTEVFRDAGFHTAGFLGSFVLAGLFGFAQGFDYFEDDWGDFVGDPWDNRDRRSALSVTNAVIKYLETRSIPRNLFLFAHYFDPHAPHGPREPYERAYRADEAAESWLAELQGRGKDLRTRGLGRALRYAGEVSFMDEHVGRLMDYLKKRGILDESLLMVTSDHGENFLEHHHHWDHGFTVYQSTMHGVCTLRLPHADMAGTKVDQLFASIDLLPTIARYLELPVPEGIDGEAVDLSRDGIAFAPRVRFGQATKPYNRPETNLRWHNMFKARCLREGQMKYIQTPNKRTEELYDLAADPREREDLLKNPTPEIATATESLRQRLSAWAEAADPLESHYNLTKWKEAAQRLESLGYVE